MEWSRSDSINDDILTTNASYAKLYQLRNGFNFLCVWVVFTFLSSPIFHCSVEQSFLAPKTVNLHLPAGFILNIYKKKYKS